jgi:hypothetical protein
MLKVKFKHNLVAFNSDQIVTQTTAPDICEMIKAENVLVQPEIQTQSKVSKPSISRIPVAPIVVKKFEYVNDEEHTSEPEPEQLSPKRKSPRAHTEKGNKKNKKIPTL